MLRPGGMRQPAGHNVVGTPEWWDDQLAHHWEANGGPSQTRHFMTRLIAHLAPPEVAYLRATPASILDWGCAMGDGVVLLAEAFPQARVAGLDIAQSAIETARRRYSDHEFIVTQTGEIPRPFDVIVTSNCLEHFDDPLAFVRAHLAVCRQFYVALVPYREFARIDTHLVTFTEATFPAYLAGWTRLYTRVVAVDPQYWAGQQLLVVYGSAEYTRHRASEGIDCSVWDAYFTAPPAVQALIDALALAQAEADTRRAAAEVELADLAALKFNGLDQAADATTSNAEASAPVKDLLVQIARQERELTTLRTQARAITGSRAWALAQALWRLRARLAPPDSWADRLLRRPGP